MENNSLITSINDSINNISSLVQSGQKAQAVDEGLVLLKKLIEWNAVLSVDSAATTPADSVVPSLPETVSPVSPKIEQPVQQPKLLDLYSLLTINQRYQAQSELFKGDKAALQNFLNELVAAEKFYSAVEVIKSYATERKWNDKSEIVIAIRKLLENHLSK